MNRWLLASLLYFVAIVASSLAAVNDDPVRNKLDRAKAIYKADIEKFRGAVSSYFEKREEAARKNGDKQLVDQIKEDQVAFADKGELPKSAPAALRSQRNVARSSLESAYELAIREYTKAKQDDAAATIEKELNEFRKQGSAGAEVSAGPFQAKSIWVGDVPPIVLTVIERKGDTFRATVVVGERHEREVSGAVKDGKVSWLAKDVRAIRGEVGGDNFGTLISEKSGDRIDFVWRSGKDTGTFTLRLKKGT